MDTIAGLLQEALEIIDSIDTYCQTWEESDEALQRVEGRIKEAQTALSQMQCLCPKCVHGEGRSRREIAFT